MTLRITGIQQDSDEMRQIKLIGLRWVDSTMVSVEVRCGDDGLPVTLLLKGESNQLMSLELEDCISLTEIPSAEINTDVFAKAVNTDLITTTKNVLWCLFSAILAETATLEVEREESQGEIVFTLTCGKYTSQVRRSFSDLKPYLLPE